MLTEREEAKLRSSVLSRKGRKADRDLVLLELLLDTGLRLGSLMQLDVDDVRFFGKRRIIRAFKGGSETRRFLRPLRRSFDSYLGGEQALSLSNQGRRISVCQVRGIVAGWGGETVLPKLIPPQLLRHTFPMLLYERGLAISPGLRLFEKALGF